MSEPALVAGEPRLRSALRALALIRIAAVPVVLAGERLVEHPALGSGGFDATFLATAAYALVALWFSFDRRFARIPPVVYPALDLVVICALAYTSGGAFSQLRYAFFLLPVGAAFLLRPGATAVASLASVAAYLAVSLPHPATEGADIEFVLVQALYLAWMGLAAVLLSGVLTRRARRIDELAAGRRLLVAEALEAEERERRRLAEALHDEAIQNLLAAGQELQEAGGGGPAWVDRARVALERTVKQLRTAVFDLHPYVLEHAGLGAALQSVTDEYARRAGLEPVVSVDPAATGHHDQLLLSLARELVANVAAHAGARSVAVRVELGGAGVRLEVVDDGRGVDTERVARAVSEGHIGLASCRERVEALGGRFGVEGGPGRGTTVRVELPLVPAAQAEGGSDASLA